MQDPLGPGDDWFAARGPRGVLQEFIQTKLIEEVSLKLLSNVVFAICSCVH